MCRRPLLPARIAFACIFPVLLLFSIVTPGITHADSSLTCQPAHFSVVLAAGQTTHYKMAGELCTRNHPGYVVQLLIPGGSYTHQYWHWPVQPALYSYVDALTTPNYSTLSIDPLGSGASSPGIDSNLVTLDAAAYTVHQIVQALRQGIGGVAFSKVVLVGHSIGSYVLWDEAATYHDVDGAIVTGAPHQGSQANDNVAFNYVYPAVQDSKFANSGLDSGWYTTTAASQSQPITGRQKLFYNVSDADPAIISYDEQTKDVFPLNELLQGLNSGNFTNQITVPVLTVVGQDDFFFCAPDGTDCTSDQTFQAAEAPDYPPQACLEAHILAGSGHDINLHINAGDWFNMALKWLNQFFGDNPVQPGHCN